MKAISAALGQPDDLVLPMPDPVAGPGEADRDQIRGAEFLRHPDDSGQVSDRCRSRSPSKSRA
jgi:hypothetical protein